MSKKKSGRRVWRGVTTATASLLALSVCASTVVDGFRTDIDKFLGTKSTKLVTEDSDGTDLYTFKSDYTSTTELLHGIQDVGERMSEEGSVLLKNNGALPLTQDETQKITLLGFSSYYPVQGGDMGSSLVENTGTDADTVDMVQAFKAKGFSMNQTVADMYDVQIRGPELGRHFGVQPHHRTFHYRRFLQQGAESGCAGRPERHLERQHERQQRDDRHDCPLCL